MFSLAKQYGRYGYRKIAELLRIEGWQVNHKKVERLWREEGLQIPQRHRKRKRLYHKDSSVIRLRPRYQNHIWSIDFVHDKLANGRPYKMLTVLDEYTREALCVAVRTRMGCQWRSKKGPPRRCKKGPLGGCGLVPVVHGRAPRATRRALNRLTRRRAREGPVGPRGQAWAGWSVQLAVGV